MSDDQPPDDDDRAERLPAATSALSVLAQARRAALSKAPREVAMKKRGPKGPAPRRDYSVLEGKVGQRLEQRPLPAVRAFSGAPLAAQLLPARASEKRALPERSSETETLTPAKKLQLMIERTVKTLLMTATPEGDLTFRADIDAAVMSDLSVDVTLFGRQLIITFYTQDESVRRLLQGYERELIAHLESRRFKVKELRVLREPDPNEAPPVPIGR